LILVGWSIGCALTAPGTDSVAARLAEWGRDHGLGGLITWLEKQQYDHNQPAVGGTPAGGIPQAAGAVPEAPAPGNHPGPDGLPEPAPMPSLTGTPLLPGEGQWQTVATVHGHAAVRVTTLRPDESHTSFVAGVMWIDPTFVRGVLQPGTTDPGGTWQAATSITPALQRSVVAAFNAGFRLNGDSHGGYYSEGRTPRPLVDGAASLVLRTDGTATVGSWNQEVRMGPEVASVRQNLVELVDNGQVNPTCATGGTAQWGSTIGQAAYIHRSAFGVTADGAEVYVGGPALSVCTLGRILQAAGVVRGMELDINPAWVSGTYFHDRPTGPPQGFKLFPAEEVSPQHYFSPSSRDWFGWYARD
ncbi:phosphodiester glycosidase family protein, partial [Amycolatopsis rhizosphaerae]